MAINYDAVGILAGDEAHTLKGTAAIYTLSTVVGTAVYTLAAATARSIAADFANDVTKKAGDVSINASDKYKHYMELAKDLDKRAASNALGATSVYAGGISKSDKDTRESDTDRVEPYFTRTQFDDPGTDYDDDDDGYT